MTVHTVCNYCNIWHHPNKKKNDRMVALLLVIVGVLCITDAIRPSVIPPNNNKAAAASRFRRPFRRLSYRRSDDNDSLVDSNNNHDITKGPRIPALDQLRDVDNTGRSSRSNNYGQGNQQNQSQKDSFPMPMDTSSPVSPKPQQGQSQQKGNERITKEALAKELSSLMEGVEKLSEQVEATRSIPPYPATSGERKRNNSATATATGENNDSDNKYNKIKTVQELRKAILDDGKELRDIELDAEAQLLVNATAEQLLNHDVIELMVKRFRTGSTPGNRAPEDTARLALSIEGGGMRGAVAAGMASAIACLGLSDTFDAVYGSSAGSVIGSYMISRQMCMDVYVDILPAAKKKFVCTKRMMSALAVTAVDMFLKGVYKRSTSNSKGKAAAILEEEMDAEIAIADLPAQSRFAARAAPGMNISFILDGIMCQDNGIRPLDMEAFQKNDKLQKLRIASSYSKNGKLLYKCFGTEDFFGEQPTIREDGKRKGLFACLEPSMTVPGATGPPVRLRNHDSDEVHSYFDAFCFEPLPYRSAVEEGATHVLVLCSRPEGFEPKTKPGVYEQAIAPLYFKSHNLPEVADYFKRGGQQYIYLEDMMTLEEGKVAGMNKEGPIAVPPARLLYAIDQDHDVHEWSTQRDEKWRKAHLLPLKVPLGTPELATLEQDQNAVREAVMGGFAAAFDLLAPAIGLNTHHELTGAEIASLIFPQKPGMLDEIILREKLHVEGDPILHRTVESVEVVNLDEVDESPSGRRRRNRARRDRFLKNARHVLRVLARRKRQENSLETGLDHPVASSAPGISLQGGRRLSQLPASLSEQQKAEHLLDLLPGLKSGRLSQLAANLRQVAESSDHSSTATATSEEAATDAC